MLRLTVVERDAARRDSLNFLLSQAGYDVQILEHSSAVSQLTQSKLLILGDGDLQLLDDLPRSNHRLAVLVLVLINPGNCSGILSCLSAGVAGVISRQRRSDEILEKVRTLVDAASLEASVPVLAGRTHPQEQSLSSDGTSVDEAYRAADLIEALHATCEDVGRLQEQYAEELTHRRKVEQALMESEAFYQSLVETLPVAMLRKDLNGRFTFANRLLCDAFKRPVEAIIGHSDHDFFPQELADKYRADDRRVVEQGRDFETTEEFQTPTGELRYTHVVKTPVYDASGNPVGIQGIFSDVTEKERAERELLQTKARLQAVLDAATQVAIISTEIDGRINIFNTGAVRMLGYAAEEMLGKTPAEFHLASEVQSRGVELSRQFGRTIQGFDVFVEYARRGDHEVREWTYVRKDGSHIQVNLSVTAKLDHQGEILGFLGIASDMTARHRAEAELVKAKEAAEAANRAKSDFLANMSHEIRTPLNAIIGMTELVRDTELNTTQREYLAMVQESGESLMSVINDILDFSKIEAGKLNIERVGFNLRELLGDTMKSLALRAHRKRLELACHVAPAVVAAVEGDPHRLRQIVVNLVGNAIKFTEQGEVVLDVDLEPSTDQDSSNVMLPAIKIDTLDCESASASGAVTSSERQFPRVTGSVHDLNPDRAQSSAEDHVSNGVSEIPREIPRDASQGEIPRDIVLHFRVTDTGIGISANKLSTIFEAFEQADTSTTRRYGGTGLGLAISSRLIELMQGRIWVESEVGRGSTFHFLVSFGISTIDTEACGSTIYPKMLNGLRVLVVDDNATNRRILVEMLSNWMMQPEAVSSVSQALTELKRKSDDGEPYAMVLTDANMPEVDGFELARRIHENPTWCRSMVMMLTSGDRPDDIQRCRELGIAVYLIKPVKQSELLDAILVAVGGQSALVGSQELAPGSGRTTANPKSILLAEDSLINQKLAIGLLEKWGHRVTVANNGLEAVQLSGKETFDLILMDVQMPELDGLAATREIRRREEVTGEHLAIMAMTAHAMKGDRERCLESGMDEYLMKPIRAEQLFNSIERMGVGTISRPADPAPIPLVTAIPQATTKMTGTDQVDWEIAMEAVNSDEELLCDVIDAFLEEAPQLIEAMHASKLSGELKRFQRAAHTLKSGLRMFGVSSLAEDVEKFELLTKSGSLPTTGGPLDAVTERTQGILAEMSEYLQTHRRVDRIND